MLTRLISFIFIMLLLPGVPVLASENDPVIARAGDFILKMSDLDRLISYYGPEKQKYLLENPQQKITLVKRIMEVKIISDVARKEGFDNNTAVKEQMQYMLNDFLSKEYLSMVVMQKVTVSDEDLKQYYALNKNKFLDPAQVKARHILIKFPPKASADEKKKAMEKAKEILERARKGADFGKLAEEYSEDTVSRKKGGDLGFFAKGKMVKPFEKAAFSLKPGEISDIVETNYGYHIIKVDDYKEERTKSYDEVKETIKEQVATEFAKSRAEEFLSAATKNAGMEIFSDKITGRSKDK